MNNLYKINANKNYNLKTILVHNCALLFLLFFVEKSSASNYSDQNYSTHHVNRIQPATVLQLNEGDICKEGQGINPVYVCVNRVKCKPSSESIKRTKIFEICSIDGSQICCPSSAVIGRKSKRAIKISKADEKCQEYSKLPFSKETISSELTAGEQYLGAVLKTLGGPRIAEHQEFPHLAMLGYGIVPEIMDWRCAGSLISEKWILTAAHCHKMGGLARWARLGDVDRSPINAGQHEDYPIDDYVLHPKYKVSERYFDIALFRLAKQVKFSASIRPICLNTDSSFDQSDYPVVNVWGKSFIADKLSDSLIRVPLRNIPVSTCRYTYNALELKDPKLTFGVDSDSMICAGTFNVAQLVCTGDSGGALQIPHETYPDAYRQIGVTSFGSFCGIRNTPGVYTKVSKYVDWIESVVWPSD